MNLSGHYFIYDGKSSEQYGLKVLNLNTDRLDALAAEIEYKTSFSRGLKRFKIKGIDYSKDPLSFEIEFLSEVPIDPYTATQVRRWLFNRAQPKKLYCDPQYDNTLSVVNGQIRKEYLNCVFYNPVEVRAANGLRGWKATCLTDGIMAVQDEVTFTATDFTGNITVNVDTAIDDYTYPQMELVLGSDADTITVTITNTSDDNRQMIIENVNPQAILTIDNEVGTITDDSDNSLYGKLVNKRFLRLLPGKNVLTVSGKVASLTFKFSNARWTL